MSVSIDLDLLQEIYTETLLLAALQSCFLQINQAALYESHDFIGGGKRKKDEEDVEEKHISKRKKASTKNKKRGRKEKESTGVVKRVRHSNAVAERVEVDESTSVTLLRHQEPLAERDELEQNPGVILNALVDVIDAKYSDPLTPEQQRIKRALQVVNAIQNIPPPTSIEELHKHESLADEREHKRKMNELEREHTQKKNEDDRTASNHRAYVKTMIIKGIGVVVIVGSSLFFLRSGYFLSEREYLQETVTTLARSVTSAWAYVYGGGSLGFGNGAASWTQISFTADKATKWVAKVAPEQETVLDALSAFGNGAVSLGSAAVSTTSRLLARTPVQSDQLQIEPPQSSSPGTLYEQVVPAVLRRDAIDDIKTAVYKVSEFRHAFNAQVDSMLANAWNVYVLGSKGTETIEDTGNKMAFADPSVHEKHITLVNIKKQQTLIIVQILLSLTNASSIANDAPLPAHHHHHHRQHASLQQIMHSLDIDG